MKKIWMVLIFLLLTSFVLALNEPDAGIGGEDVEKIEELQTNYSPIGDDGNIDFDKYKPFRTKFDERVEKINLWLTENASWLKVVFGMVPSLTSLFGINLFLFLGFFVYLVLRGNITIDFLTFGLFIDILDKRVNLGAIEWTWGNFLGLGIFLVLNFTGMIAQIANYILNFFYNFWNKILPAGSVVATIVIVIIIIVIIFLPNFFWKFMKKFVNSVKEKKERRAKEKEEENRQILEGVTSGLVRN